ncbi:MAG: 1-(5-phosphoribosyl)-5-[(5-phosphoribosylamino)methylideneamino]imidazole-4-carboxamide isomerase [Dehalococcoidia bacterium]|nr:1-(5-phosphoribosyl)-5-[(5-phosphoribosylamino)methylideneamino]imidazole-4-carboxamide isomerase [Dehalococcoidia bacterium]
MDIIPAIDLKGGKCVRLYQGDYSKETVFSVDPVATALKWQEQGASRLHLVDLDGAAAGEVRNTKAIEDIVKNTSLEVELGGGIRRTDVVEQLIKLGVKRVILGTVAVEQIELTKRIIKRFGEAIVVGIDARDSYVTTHGWMKISTMTVLDLSQAMAAIGARRIIYTDVKRDGTLTEPNYETTAELVNKLKIPVVASGGISSIEHIRKLAALGVEGVIIGKALYTGDIDLKEALAIS